MNYPQLYLTIFCLTISTILPATASNLPKISTSTVATTTVNSSSNSSLQAAQKLNQRGAEFLAVGKPDQALKIATTRQDRAAIDRINLSLGTTLKLMGGMEQEQAAIDTYHRLLLMPHH
jgi:hypothetical protein